jgi:phage major head subunit gpT-like protein
MIINHANLAELFRGFKSNFQRGFELAAPISEEVTMVVPSSTSEERYDWLGVAEGMKEWLGDRVIESLETHGFFIENKDWENTIGVQRNKVEDDQHGVYAPRVQRMGEATRLHRDELVFEDLFNLGQTADHVAYDDVPFFSAVHPNRDTGTLSNVDTGGAGPFWFLLDLSSIIKPFIWQTRKREQFVSKTSITDDNVFFQKQFIFGVDARYNVGYGLWQQAFASNQTLNEANLESAWETMDGLVADNGKPLNIMPTHLYVPTTLRFEMTRLLDQRILATGEQNIHAGALQGRVSKHLLRS